MWPPTKYVPIERDKDVTNNDSIRSPSPCLRVSPTNLRVDCGIIVFGRGKERRGEERRCASMFW